MGVSTGGPWPRSSTFREPGVDADAEQLVIGRSASSRPVRRVKRLPDIEGPDPDAFGRPRFRGVSLGQFLQPADLIHQVDMGRASLRDGEDRPLRSPWP